MHIFPVDTPTAPTAHCTIWRFAAAAACAMLADWLFFGWHVGLSLAIFLAVIGLLAIVGRPSQAPWRVQILASGAFLVALLAIIEEVNPLSVCLGISATALFAIVMPNDQWTAWRRSLLAVANIPWRGPYHLLSDTLGILRHARHSENSWLQLGSLIAWVVPIVLLCIFLALFAAANPVIEKFLHRIDQEFLGDLLTPVRIGFWFLVIAMIWPLLRLAKPRQMEAPSTAIQTHVTTDWDYLLGGRAVLRSLVLFNALFALQTSLDLAFLWGGLNLPEGVSHAEYAHRGAYPLIVTALLAAGFVLVTMRPAGPARTTPLIRPLVLIWTGQNVVLAISSILRLDLYVAAYSLTYWRFAAFVWMLLVAVGLILIFFQILCGKRNTWLIDMNAIVLVIVLFACGFINVPSMIATYNITHSRPYNPTGPILDLYYLRSLGPQILPAVEARIPQNPELEQLAGTLRRKMGFYRLFHPQHWRGWSFRKWRLDQYLVNNPEILASSADRAGQ